MARVAVERTSEIPATYPRTQRAGPPAPDRECPSSGFRAPVRRRHRGSGDAGSGQCAAEQRQPGAGRYDRHPGPEAWDRDHQRRGPIEGVFGGRQRQRRIAVFGVSRPRHPRPRRHSGDADIAAAASRRTAANASARRSGANQRTVAAVDNIRRMVQQDPGILDQVMRTVASYDNAAGKLRGFRAYPGRNRAIFSKLGLKPGDLVTAINGQPLDDPQRSQEVFNTIQTSDHVTVTIERGGQRQDISLNIAEVANEATRDLEADRGARRVPRRRRGAERRSAACTHRRRCRRRRQNGSNDN